MKTIYGKIIMIILMVCLICQFHDHIEKPLKKVIENKVEKDMIVEVKTKNQTLHVPLEDYLVGVLAGEMPVSFHLEALKAQAVASRTFVLSRKLVVDNTTASQVYLSDEQMKEQWGKNYQTYKDKIKEAIDETRSQVMTYQGKYISALFFSSSNGQTVNCEDYFQGEVAYLKAVDSHWDLTIDPKNQREKSFTQKELSKIFGVNIQKIKISSYTDSHYVKDVMINDKTYTGRDIRETLGLSSSCFEINKQGQTYTFVTYGSGHGVGMSQYGAQAMALEGYKYQDILKHYYQNIKIQSIDS